MRKIQNNPWTPRLQDPPPSKLPCSPGESARSACFGGLEFYATTAEERQSMFAYGKEG